MFFCSYFNLTFVTGSLAKRFSLYKIPKVEKPQLLSPGALSLSFCLFPLTSGLSRAPTITAEAQQNQYIKRCWHFCCRFYTIMQGADAGKGLCNLSNMGAEGWWRCCSGHLFQDQPWGSPSARAPLCVRSTSSAHTWTDPVLPSSEHFT